MTAFYASTCLSPPNFVAILPTKLMLPSKTATESSIASKAPEYMHRVKRVL